MGEAFSIITNKLRKLFGLKPQRLVTDRERALRAADQNQDGLLNANELNEYLRRHPDRATDLLGIETAKDLYSRFDPEHPLQLEQKLGFGASTTDEADGINLTEELSSYY